MPEFVEKRYITKIGKIDIPKISLLKQKKKKITEKPIKLPLYRFLYLSLKK